MSLDLCNEMQMVGSYKKPAGFCPFRTNKEDHSCKVQIERAPESHARLSPNKTLDSVKGFRQARLLIADGQYRHQCTDLFPVRSRLVHQLVVLSS
jgi:hypothetical protein